MDELMSARGQMRRDGIDAWLVYDFRGSNDVLWQVLGARVHTTRRAFLLLPAEGPSRALAHALDRPRLEPLLGAHEVTYYHTWREMEGWLAGALRGARRVAMEYSPGCAIPTLSIVDGGMLELVRATGPEVVSSADLFQSSFATWAPGAVRSHLEAAEEVAASLRAALAHVRAEVGGGRRPTEHDVRLFISRELARRGLEADEAPIVAVNANSGDPHYEPPARGSAPIGAGDWLLIDLWARRPGAGAVYADITWVAYLGAQVPPRHRAVFDLVAGARDAVVERLRAAWAGGETLAGWELDDVARAHIAAGGLGDRFVHRTGHSMGPGGRPHALGVNLDNFETHDTRLVVPGVGFSVEPGVYLEEFGVRSEINVFMDPESGPRVTTPLQRAVELLSP